jgi:hypothetical protein
MRFKAPAMKFNSLFNRTPSANVVYGIQGVILLHSFHKYYKLPTFKSRVSDGINQQPLSCTVHVV